MFSVLAIVVLMLTIPRRVHVVVPAVPDEIDRLAAGVIGATMPGPVPRMPRRYAQIERRGRIGRRLVDDDRLRVDDLRWRVVADLDAAVVARLADIDGDVDIPCMCGNGGERCGDRNCMNKALHGEPPLIVNLTN